MVTREKIYPINPKLEQDPRHTMLPGYRKPARSRGPGPDLHSRPYGPRRSSASVANKGIRGAVILASGFSEMGGSGSELEQKLLEAAQEAGVRIIGPNTSGIFNLHKNLNLLALDQISAGDIGIISQSGNMLLSLALEAADNGPYRIQHLCRPRQPERPWFQ